MDEFTDEDFWPVSEIAKRKLIAHLKSLTPSQRRRAFHDLSLKMKRVWLEHIKAER